MIKYIFITIFLLFTLNAIAQMSITSGFDYVLQAPPKTSDSRSLYAYLYQMYVNWNTLQVTKTFPVGNVDSSHGNVAVYFDGTNYWIMVQTTSPNGTAWVGTKLGVIS